MRAHINPQHIERRLLKNIFANIPLYKMLTEEQLDYLVAASRSIRASNNDWIVEQGDPPRGVFVMVFGQARVGFDRKDGAEKTVAILGPNHCFGLAETILNEAHLGSLRTISDAMIVQTPREKVLEVAQANFAFTRELMTCSSRQVYSLMQDIQRHALANAKQRLAGHLLRQSKRQAADMVELIASKTLIASHLNISGETLSRLFHEFSSQGMISVKGRQVKILNPSKMQALLAN